LACSDGVWDVVSDEAIARVLRQMSPQQAADELVKQANAAGGPDNISAVVARVPAAAEAALAGAKPGSALGILAGMVIALVCAVVLTGGFFAKRLLGGPAAAPAVAATPGPVVLAMEATMPAPTATLGKPTAPAPTPTLANAGKPAVVPSATPATTPTPANTPSATPPPKPAQIFVCGAAQFEPASGQCKQDEPVVDLAGGAGIYATWPPEWVKNQSFSITWRKMGGARVASYQCDFDASGQVSCKPVGRSSFAARQTASGAYIEQGDSFLENAKYQLTLSTASGTKEKVFNIKIAR
jgi:hypothetical protein